jgi:Flp pilus assembly protein TadD
MATDTLPDQLILSGEPVNDRRLRPTEIHDAVRHQLEELAAEWGLQRDDAHKLARGMRTHRYGPGEVILPGRARTDFWGLIVRGLVGVHDSHYGFDRPIALLLPGSTLGSVAPAARRPSSTTLRALTRCEISFLHRDNLEALSAEPLQGHGRAGSRSRWPRRVLLGSALLCCICLLVALTLGDLNGALTTIEPDLRYAAALGPMALGQLCIDSRLESSRCAERSWTAAAKLAPEVPGPLLALGTFYFQAGELAVAEQMFETAGRLAPDLGEVQNNLGLVHAERGEHERAIVAFQRALALEPGVAAIEHNLGISLQALNAHDQALVHFRRALAFDEPRATTLASMAVSYYATGQVDQAAEAAQKTLAVAPQSVTARALLGAIALERHVPEVAVFHLREANALDPGYGLAYYYLGLAYDALGRQAEAIAAFEQSLAHADGTSLREQSRGELYRLYLATD